MNEKWNVTCWVIFSRFGFRALPDGPFDLVRRVSIVCQFLSDFLDSIGIFCTAVLKCPAHLITNNVVDVLPDDCSHVGHAAITDFAAG